MYNEITAGGASTMKGVTASHYRIQPGDWTNYEFYVIFTGEFPDQWLVNVVQPYNDKFRDDGEYTDRVIYGFLEQIRKTPTDMRKIADAGMDAVGRKYNHDTGKREE